MDATIKPLIKPLDDYFGTQLTDNYDQVTWDINAENLLINFCNISIPAVSQNQNTTPTSGGKSFIYDTAGNSSASSIYNPGTNPTLPNGYSSDELLQIKNAIILSPNPTYDIVNVNITGIAQGKVISVNVLSGNGSLLFTKTDLNNSANYFFTFNLSNQITGVYIANFTLNTGQVVTKNVIKY
ncbi:T9SS type A sorting domain-containing protein [Chryseobacterium wanjuense]